MGIVSSSTDSESTEQSGNNLPKRKGRRKLIVSSDSDRCAHVSKESSLSEGDSSSEDDFQEVRRRFRGNHGYLSRKPKRKSRRGMILPSSDEESVSEKDDKADSSCKSIESDEERSSESDEKGSQGKDKDVQG